MEGCPPTVQGPLSGQSSHGKAHLRGPPNFDALFRCCRRHRSMAPQTRERQSEWPVHLDPPPNAGRLANRARSHFERRAEEVKWRKRLACESKRNASETLAPPFNPSTPLTTSRGSRRSRHY